MNDTQRYISALRSQLFEMSKLSQRAVDYSIKAYMLGRPEFCRHVQSTQHEFDEVHRCLVDRCRKLLSAGLPPGPDAAFIRFILRTCGALFAMVNAASEIAREVTFSLQKGRVQQSLALEQLGSFVNRLVRLCSVALYKGGVQNAKRVFQSPEVRRCFERIVHQADSDIGRWRGAQATFELAIMKNLSEIAQQTHVVANAITPWPEKNGRIEPFFFAACVFKSRIDTHAQKS